MEPRNADARTRGRGLIGILASAIVPFAIIVGLEWLLGLSGLPPAPVWFHLAIIAAAWTGGWWAGLIVLALSFAAIEGWILEPSLLDEVSRRTVTRAIVFLSAGLFFTIGAAVVSSSRRRAAESARRAAELTSELRRASEQVEASAARSRRLQDVTAALLRALTPGQVVESILNEGLSAAGATMGLVLLGDRDGAVVAGARGCPESLLKVVRGTPPAEGGLAGALAGEPAWREALPLIDAAPTAPSGRESWAVLPLSVRDRPVGALALGFAGGPPVGPDERTWLLLMAQECAKALDHARLYAAERSARVQAQFAERQVGFLASASARLAATLDTSRMLADVADLAVTNLGDFCAIHVVGENAVPVLVAGSIAMGATTVRFGGDDARYPVDASADVGHPAVLRMGKAELIAEVDDSVLERLGGTAESVERLRALGLVSQVCVPLRARERVLGAITIASCEPGRRFSYAELVLAEELASRVAQTLDNAQLYQNALQASRAKSSFLAVMSHELRTPLNAILGYSDLILLGVQTDISDQTRHQVERIRSAAGRLLQLVDDVLNFARVESGSERVRVGPVAMDDAVAEALAMVRPLSSEKGLTVTSNAPTGIMLHTDAGKLVQILNNLLSNAAKFTHAGSVDVKAWADGGDVRVAVCDTGIGIEVENLQRIFDPFWQAEQTPTRRFGGTGIGLGVARHLARLLGGDITVSSTPGQGSTFTLRMPLRYEEIPPAA
jgi:signal transduction histidine kinase